MGVKKLRALIKRYAPTAIREGVSFSEFKGAIFVIDASLRIYKWSLVTNARTDAEGNVVNHIHGAFALTDCLRAAGITSVYVFDGEPPEEKGAVINARTAARESGACKTPDTRVWSETRELLDLLGVAHFTADGEADPVIAAATHIGEPEDIDDEPDEAIPKIYAMTDDLDALAFGAKYVVLDVDCIKKTCTLITLSQVLSGLQMSLDEFIDICILLGCDYTDERIKGIGIVNAMKMIRTYGNIETALNESNILAPDGFRWDLAQAVFANVPNVPREHILEPDLGILYKSALKSWLIKKCGALNTRMTRVLAK